jgi:hypothetical protein
LVDKTRAGIQPLEARAVGAFDHCFERGSERA